jgi:S4 domain protein YaaA
MIEITIFKEPITLGQFLKFSGLISTGGEVKNFLEESTIFVNNITENRRGKKLFSGDLIEINGQNFKIKLENDN